MGLDITHYKCRKIDKKEPFKKEDLPENYEFCYTYKNLKYLSDFEIKYIENWFDYKLFSKYYGLNPEFVEVNSWGYNNKSDKAEICLVNKKTKEKTDYIILPEHYVLKEFKELLVEKVGYQRKDLNSLGWAFIKRYQSLYKTPFNITTKRIAKYFLENCLDKNSVIPHEKIYNNWKKNFVDNFEDGKSFIEFNY